MFFVREKVQCGEMIVYFVPANERVADFLTKPLTKKSFLPRRRKLGVFFVQELLELTSYVAHEHT